MKDTITTTNLADFGFHDREELIQLLRAWHEQGLPVGFYDDEVRPMMNKNSGNVFLTNSEYQCATMNGSTLELWNYCSECGHEDFEEDCELNEKGCNKCNPVEGV